MFAAQSPAALSASFPERKPKRFTYWMSKYFPRDPELARQILPMKEMPTQAV
jgi:hypothetical protein